MVLHFYFNLFFIETFLLFYTLSYQILRSLIKQEFDSTLSLVVWPPVVPKVESAIKCENHYPGDNKSGFFKIYPLATRNVPTR